MSARRLALYRRAVEVLRWLRLVIGACVIGATVFALVGWLAASRQATLAEGKLARERAASNALRQSVATAGRLVDRDGWARARAGGVLTSSAVADLNRSAQAHGNVVLSVRPVMLAETPDQKTTDPVGLEMSMQGSFDSAYAFLRELDSQALPLTIRSIDWRPRLDADQEVRLDVQLKLAVISPEE